MRKKIVTADTIALLLLTPAAIRNQDAFLIVLALLFYLGLSVWLPLSDDPEENGRQQRYGFIFRYALLLMIAATAVVMPTVLHVIERNVTPVEADGYSPAYVAISDSAVQTEAALNYFALFFVDLPQPHFQTIMHVFILQQHGRIDIMFVGDTV